MVPHTQERWSWRRPGRRLARSLRSAGSPAYTSLLGVCFPELWGKAVCCFKPSSLWSPVSAAPGNYHSDHGLFLLISKNEATWTEADSPPSMHSSVPILCCITKCGHHCGGTSMCDTVGQKGFQKAGLPLLQLPACSLMKLLALKSPTLELIRSFFSPPQFTATMPAPSLNSIWRQTSIKSATETFQFPLDPQRC